MSTKNKPRVTVDSGAKYNIDAWQNSASGMGTTTNDKSIYDQFGFSASLKQPVLSAMYKADWLSRKICERPANDAVRRWINMDDKNILAMLEKLQIKKKAKQAVSWSRLYGGSALLLITNSSPETPLKPSEKLIDVRAVDRYNIQPQGQIIDPYNNWFGEAEFYITNNGTHFHHSRVLKFYGTDLTQDLKDQELGWGGSYVELCQTAIKSFSASMQDVRHIMTESSIGMLKIPGLTEAIVSGGTIYDSINRRLTSFNLSKSLYRTAAMDGEEEFDFHARPLNGLSDLLDRFMTTVSGATDMPELILFGKTPSGLNASQEEQLAVYYDMVRSIQESDLMLALNSIIGQLNGGNIPRWDYKPLLEPSDMTKADIRLKEAQAITAVADVAALMPSTIIEHLNKTGHFDLDEFGIEDDGNKDDEIIE